MKNLSLDYVRELFPNGIERSLDKNQIVCYDGDQPNTVYFILEGHVKLYDIDEEGNEKVLHINGPRNVFPMLFAFSLDSEVKGFYSCIDRVKLLVVPLKDFHSVAQSNLDFSTTLNTWFLGEIQELVYRLSAMEKTDARSKILYALRNLAAYYSHSKKGWLAIDFPITRQFIADYTGLARETVSIAMTELEKENIVKRGRLRSLEVKADALPKN